MGEASKELTFDIAAERFYNALLDYESYPSLLPEVESIDVIETTETAAKIQYNLKLVKTFSYTLNMTHKRPQGLSWVLGEGSLFKKNSGSWEIESLAPEKCLVRYSCDVSLKIFTPKAITNKLIAVNLPRMMETFYQHAKTNY